MIPHTHEPNRPARARHTARHRFCPSRGALAVVVVGLAVSWFHANLPRLQASHTPPIGTIVVHPPKLGSTVATPLTPSLALSQDQAPIDPAIEPFHAEIAVARHLRVDGHHDAAAQIYSRILRGNAPADLKRTALLELAVVVHENQELAKAQQILAQFIHKYPRDHALPEVLLQQGLIYRQLGANKLAIAKFYAVMTAALSLKVDQFEQYQQLVQEAQTAIADTYYQTGQYREAVDFFTRLLKQDTTRSDHPLIQFRLIRSLSQLGSHPETITQSEVFLRDHPDSADTAHVRFLLASALKAQGRDTESLQQVLLLLQSQHALASEQPDAWHYWQRRAGNEIANGLYLQGDYLNALTLYRRLAELDSSPAWQLPTWYQVGLVLERLEQVDQAAEVYDRIIARQKDLPPEASQPSLDTLFQMSRLRKDHLDWIQKSRSSLLTFRNDQSTTQLPIP